MNLTFLGAAGEVTGSATLLQTKEASVLVDFGMFQGYRITEEKNAIPPELDPLKLDAVILTHAHLDHIGRLPLLWKAGYKGPIFATPATRDISGIILRDAAKIQAQDMQRSNRKRERAGLPLQEPMFTAKDVEALLKLFRDVPYEEAVTVAKGARATFLEAGHILGSTCVSLSVEGKHIVFSGDLGPKGAPILLDAQRFTKADAVVLESTYGNRDHRSLATTIAEFEEIVKQTVAKRGKLLVPTFAVGRTQLLLYVLAKMFRAGHVEKFPVFLDSPMAIDATEVYSAHEELYDEELKALRAEAPLAQDLTSLTLCETAEESMALNSLKGPCLIMAGAGMCNAGRILHHLKQNLWKPETSVLIVGYQAEGSLGRLLVEKVRTVRIHGDLVAVNAKIHTLGGFSAHAGQTDLLWWFDALAGWKPQVFLNHGEAKGREPLAAILEERYGIQAVLPEFGHVAEIG